MEESFGSHHNLDSFHTINNCPRLHPPLTAFRKYSEAWGTDHRYNGSPPEVLSHKCWVWNIYSIGTVHFFGHIMEPPVWQVHRSWFNTVQQGPLICHMTNQNHNFLLIFDNAPCHPRQCVFSKCNTCVSATKLYIQNTAAWLRTNLLLQNSIPLSAHANTHFQSKSM